MPPTLKKILRYLLPLAAGGLVILFIVAWIFYRPARLTLPRLTRLGQFFDGKSDHREWFIPAGARCGNAPFQFPADGYVGFYWGDSFRPPLRHTGLDIFGGGQPGETPVYAAHEGALSRLVDWKSTVIIRIPTDPLHPERQIWTYYTHMADKEGTSLIDAAFPPGTSEAWVEAGTLLGRMGDYSGSPGNPTGVHLHFSIVLDDGDGSFRNESILTNTLDPSPYFGRPLEFTQDPGPVPPCR